MCYTWRFGRLTARGHLRPRPPQLIFLHQMASPGARVSSIRKRCYFLSQVFVMSTSGTSAWTFWFLYDFGSSEMQAPQRADSRGGVPNWYGDDYECIAGGKAWQAGRCSHKLQLPPPSRPSAASWMAPPDCAGGSSLLKYQVLGGPDTSERLLKSYLTASLWDLGGMDRHAPCRPTTGF